MTVFDVLLQSENHKNYFMFSKSFLSSSVSGFTLDLYRVVKDYRDLQFL